MWLVDLVLGWLSPAVKTSHYLATRKPAGTVDRSDPPGHDRWEKDGLAIRAGDRSDDAKASADPPTR